MRAWTYGDVGQGCNTCNDGLNEGLPVKMRFDNADGLELLSYDFLSDVVIHDHAV